MTESTAAVSWSEQVTDYEYSFSCKCGHVTYSSGCQHSSSGLRRKSTVTRSWQRLTDDLGEIFPLNYWPEPWCKSQRGIHLFHTAFRAMIKEVLATFIIIIWSWAPIVLRWCKGNGKLKKGNVLLSQNLSHLAQMREETERIIVVCFRNKIISILSVS